MIEESPPLVTATSVERASAEGVAQFRRAPTSFVVDALGGRRGARLADQTRCRRSPGRRRADLRLRTLRQSCAGRSSRVERAGRRDRRGDRLLHRRRRRRSPARHRRESRRRRLRHRLYRDLLREACAREGVAVWSYCLMANHVHLILTPKKPERLGRALGKA